MATIEDLTNAEQSWVDANLAILREAGVDVADPASLGAFYDQLLADWLTRPEQDRSDPNSLINMIGIGLGQCIVDRCGLRWVVATDDGGTELALHRIANNVLVYPANAVAKRWVARSSGFIPAFVDATTSRVEGLSSADG
ncbi:MAG TPA: DUF3806 domain-containing protein [Micromonosporaceae bacterium]